MSPLFAERVLLSVGADRLHCVRLAGWRGKRRSDASFALSVQDGAPQFDALSAWLGQVSGRLEVVLSNAWVRYVIVPWQEALSNEQLTDDFARALFAQQYGDISAAWRMTVSPFVPGRPRIAVALDARWLDALQALAAAHKLRLAAVRPSLAAVFDRIAARLPADALLAMVEPRRLALLHLEQGHWRSVHNRMLPAQWTSHLPSFITQASAALGTLTTPLFIIAPQHERPDLGQLQGTWLRLPSKRHFDPRRDLSWSLCLGV